MLEDDNYRIDFEKMTVWRKQDFTAGMPCPIMKLDDCLYVGSPDYFHIIQGGVNWHYMGKDRSDSRRYFELYISYLLEKAVGFDSADEA